MGLKKESFRWRIFIYNVMLLTLVAVVCTMYFLLNDDTLSKYNNTFMSYNELNHYYSDVKTLHTSYEAYLQSGELSYLEEVKQAKEDGEHALQNVEASIENKIYADEVAKLHEMLEALADVSVTYQDVHEVKNLKEVAHTQYLEIMRTRGDYYEIVTTDMQQYRNHIEKNHAMLVWMSAGLIGCLLLWIIYFSKAMFHSITVPIETIIHNIHQIKMGEYDLTQISNTNEEMNVLCLALEDMAKSVQKNMQYAKEKAELEKRVLEQQNENLKKDELLAQGELRILQNQVNPHFLFNTLNMIYKQAYSEEAYKTSELMERTSQLLRYSLDNANKVSFLRNELKAVENYMYIQEKRFHDRMKFHLEIGEDIPNIAIPTMILQPLVENAVMHGLHDVLEGGEVIVSAISESQEVILLVSDNGKGMPAEKLEQLILNDFYLFDDEREHIGLYNVTKRLSAFYHEQVNIIVNSCEECGFEIVIRIRKEEA